MKYDWHPRPQLSLNDLKALCPQNSYQIIKKKDLPVSLVSQGLLDKCRDEILVIHSGDLSNRTYAMFNLNRVDGCKIDQMPFGFFIGANGPVGSGLLVQHGNYHPDRTIQSNSSSPLKTMPENHSSPIEKLRIDSQLAAFRTVVDKLDQQFPPTERNSYFQIEINLP